MHKATRGAPEVAFQDLPDILEIEIVNRSRARKPQSLNLHRVAAEACWINSPGTPEAYSVTLYDAGRGRAGVRIGAADSLFEIIAHDNPQQYRRDPLAVVFDRFLPTHIDDHYLHEHATLPEMRAVVRLPAGDAGARRRGRTVEPSARKDAPSGPVRRPRRHMPPSSAQAATPIPRSVRRDQANQQLAAL